MKELANKGATDGVVTFERFAADIPENKLSQEQKLAG